MIYNSRLHDSQLREISRPTRAGAKLPAARGVEAAEAVAGIEPEPKPDRNGTKEERFAWMRQRQAAQQKAERRERRKR